MIGNKALDLVEEYTYLGQIVSANPLHKKEIVSIKMGRRDFGKHSLVMNYDLPLFLKRQMYNHRILPVLTYGSEIWHLTKELERNLGTLQRGMKRKMLV